MGVKSKFQWWVNNTVVHVLTFGLQFKMFSCFVLGKCTMSHLQASKPDEKSKRPRSFGWVSSDCSSYHLWDHLVKMFSWCDFKLYTDVNFMCECLAVTCTTGWKSDYVHKRSMLYSAKVDRALSFGIDPDHRIY